MSKEEDELKTSRRSFTKSAITALALSQIVTGTRLAYGDPQDKRKPIQDGSPITVGGGGGGEIDTKKRSLIPVYVLFEKYQDYPTLDTGEKKKKLFRFQQPKPVKTLKVTINRREYNLSDWIPDDGKGCSLEIKGSKGSNWHIDMSIDHAGVKFHTGNFPPEVGNEHQCKPEHQCDDGDNHISRITFKTPFEPKKFEWDDIEATNEVKVFIDIV